MTRNSKWKWKQGFVLSECYPIQEFKHTWMTGLPLSSLSPYWAAQSKLHFPKQLIKFTGSPGEGSETLTSNPQASTLMKEKTSTAHSLIWVAGMMTDLSVKHIRLQIEREKEREMERKLTNKKNERKRATFCVFYLLILRKNYFYNSLFFSIKN